jgi:hypothetical protein
MAKSTLLQFQCERSAIAWGDLRGPVPQTGELVRLPQGAYDVLGVSYEYERDREGDINLSKIVVQVADHDSSLHLRGA